MTDLKLCFSTILTPSTSHFNWLWVFFTLLFFLFEFLSPNLTFIWFANASFIMIFVSFLPLPLPLQTGIFIIISGIFILATKKIARKISKKPKEKTNADSVIGKKALVTKEISPFNTGIVMIKGVAWSAKAVSVIPVNTKVTVKHIEGVCVFVEPSV